MSPEHVVVVPSAPALLPGYAGLEDPLRELRAAARAAVAWLVSQHPGEVSLLAADPRPDNVSRGVVSSAGERVGRQLLLDVGFGGQVEDRAAGLLVVANGSACRSEKAPGHLDERSFDFDRHLDSALRSGSPSALRDVDVALGQDLWAHDVPAFVTLGERVSGPVSAEIDYAEDPFGVQYWVVRWTCGS
jgi:hypothetical protein